MLQVVRDMILFSSLSKHMGLSMLLTYHEAPAHVHETDLVTSQVTGAACHEPHGPHGTAFLVLVMPPS